MRNLILRSGRYALPFLVITLIIVCGDYCVEMISLQYPQYRQSLQAIQTTLTLTVCLLFLFYHKAPAQREI